MAPSRSIAHKLRTALTLGPRRQLLVAEAAASMLAARLMLAVFPFRRVARRFGAFVPPTDSRVAAQAQGRGVEQARIAKEIGWAVRVSAPWMPFRSVCLQQAMAAHAMLRRRGISGVMHFGAGKSDTKPIDAHAWLDAAGVKVTGYPVAPHIAELGCFI
jgi:hypothetical protein